jgi:cysteine desulfurase/selenocysteine lyase
VEALVAENSRTLSSGLADIPGVELVREFNPQWYSGIVSFKPADMDLLKVQHALKRKGLICTVRGGAIRLSPHFYQAGRPVLEMLDLIEDSLSII